VHNIKVLLDALTGIPWLDDGQIEDLHTTKGHDPKKPRVEIAVAPRFTALSNAAGIDFTV
jgi:Holliday junction resolvase RusA-like endonuclease